MLVHVIKPPRPGQTAGERHEVRFKDGTPDAEVLRQLRGQKQTFGKVGPTVIRKNYDTGVDEAWDDPANPYALDHPETVIAIVAPCEMGETPREIRRLKGPVLEAVS